MGRRFESFRAHHFVYSGSLSVYIGKLPFSLNSAAYRTSFTAMCERSEDNTATRFGVGATYYMNQTQGFYGGVMPTNYGDAKFNAVENGACTKRPDTLSVKDIASTDLRIGFFRSF